MNVEKSRIPFIVKRNGTVVPYERDRIATAALRHDGPVAPGVLADTASLADLVILRAGCAPAPTMAPIRARAGR